MYTDGESHWFYNNVYHRSKGPAFTSKYMDVWMHHDKYHRLDGPAFVGKYDNIQTVYYIWGRQLTEIQYNKTISLYKHMYRHLEFRIRRKRQKQAAEALHAYTDLPDVLCKLISLFTYQHIFECMRYFKLHDQAIIGLQQLIDLQNFYLA